MSYRLGMRACAHKLATASTAIPIIVFVLLASVSPSRAQESEHWQASSRTAYSITGDVDFSPSKITFFNGAELPIEFIASVRNATWSTGLREDNHPITKLYRITKHSNPALIAGNQICGRDVPPTYLSVWIDKGAAPYGMGDDVFLTFYSGAEAPMGAKSDKICSGYRYLRPSKIQ